MLNHIRIVLIQTSHPGNIGSVARAMKTMGLHRLILVSPKKMPDDHTIEMAAGAADIIENMIIVNSLKEAIADCHLVMGTSARPRTVSWPLLNARECGEKIFQEKNEVAILFGREISGLTNEELEYCHYHIEIPASSEYSSLNLGAAVQVIAYECRMASLHHGITSPHQAYPFATAEEMDRFYVHFQEVLSMLEFLDPKAPRQLMRRIKRLFQRARLDSMEVNILRGFFGAIQKKIRLF